MEIDPIFKIGIGTAKTPELLETARQLFADNQDKLKFTKDNHYTTLETYNSNEDATTLNNQNAVTILKNAIKHNASIFYAGMGFDVNTLNFEVANLWLVQMPSESTHSVHSHYGFQLSGTFYIDLPENSNQIKFYSPLKRLEHGDNLIEIYNEYNSQFCVKSLQEGDMLFWESLLMHEVPNLKFNGFRKSIAYDLKISKKKSNLNESVYKMNLQDYIAVYNIENRLLCTDIISKMDENQWIKHSYSHPITKIETSYHDDLDMSHQNDEVTAQLQEFFKHCVTDYVANFAPNYFPIQDITRIRFNRYKVGTNMKMHHDHIHTIFDGERKGIPILSIIALLNDDFEGGDFLIFEGKKLKLTVGDVIVFPSNFLYPHGVTTITNGTRYSCVAWAY